MKISFSNFNSLILNILQKNIFIIHIENHFIIIKYKFTTFTQIHILMLSLPNLI